MTPIAIKTQSSFREAIRSGGVCSFGGNPRSILMWSHYAGNHRGICLQFENARDLAIFGQALPVNYSDDYPVLNWVKEAQNITKALLRKHSGWEYERERRIVVPEAARELIKFRPIALSGIIIGCYASEKTVDLLNEILVERKSLALPMPKLYRAFTHESLFRLCIRREVN